MNVIKLYEGDPRAGELAGAITDLIYERGQGISFPTILGVLDIVKAGLIKEQDAKVNV